MAISIQSAFERVRDIATGGDDGALSGALETIKGIAASPAIAPVVEKGRQVIKDVRELPEKIAERPERVKPGLVRKTEEISERLFEKKRPVSDVAGLITLVGAKAADISARIGELFDPIIGRFVEEASKLPPVKAPEQVQQAASAVKEAVSPQLKEIGQTVEKLPDEIKGPALGALGVALLGLDVTPVGVVRKQGSKIAKNVSQEIIKNTPKADLANVQKLVPNFERKFAEAFDASPGTAAEKIAQGLNAGVKELRPKVARPAVVSERVRPPVEAADEVVPARTVQQLAEQIRATPPQKVTGIRGKVASAGEKTREFFSSINDDLAQGFRSERAQFEKLSSDTKQIAQQIDDADDAVRVANTIDFNFVDNEIRALSKEERVRFIDVVEGRIPATSAAEQAALRKWETLRDVVRDRAEGIGLEVGFIPRYYPHILKREILDLVNAGSDGKILQKLMDAGQTREQAVNTLQNMKKGTNVKEFGHLEKPRLLQNVPKEFLETDPENVLFRYVSGANKRIEDARRFGVRGQALRDVLGKVAIEGGNSQLAEKILKSVFTPPKVSQTTRRVITAEVVSEMGLSAITNMGEIVLPAVRINALEATKAGFKALSKSGIEEARKLGAVSQVVEEAARVQTGQGKIVNDFLRAVGFKSVQRWADRVKVISSTQYADKMLRVLKKNPDNVLARRQLEKLGVDPDAALKVGKIAGEARIRVGVKSINDLLPLRRLDIPLFWHTDIGKTAAIFKSFGFKWGQILWRDVAKELTKGNAKPLATFMIFGALVGEGVRDTKDVAKSMITGENKVRPMPKEFPELMTRMMENLLAIGGIGMITDFVQSMRFGTFSDAGSLNFITGPAGGDVASMIDFLSDIKSGKELKKSVSELIGETVPLINVPVKKALGVEPTTRKTKGVEDRKKRVRAIIEQRRRIRER